MAARSLGMLTIDLIAKIGGFTQGMTEAERVADKKTREMQRKMQKARKEIESAWSGMSNALAAGFAGITAGVVLNKVITETRNAEREQALLAAALKATGNQAGYSQERLNTMAASMEALTGIGGGEFNQAQTVLLGFTTLVGEQLPEALKRAADFSVRTGVSMASAAETIGRAMDVPSAGMVSLQRQGFKFAESQIEAAKRLEETGRIAEAQKLVLDALDETYGGAAEAARDTFGGALTALQGTMNSLLTGGDGSFEQAKDELNTLNSLLGSSETREAFQSFISWLAQVGSEIVLMANDFALGIKYADGFWDALFKYGTANPFKTASEHLTSLRAELKEAQEDAKKALWLKSDDSQERDAEHIRGLEQQIGYWQAKANQELDKQNAWWTKNQKNRGTPSLTTPDLPPAVVGPIKLKDGPKGGKSQTEKDQEVALRFLQTLRDQAFKTQERTAWEQLHYDIQAKGLKLTEGQLAKAQGLAAAIDMAKEAEKARAAQIDRQNTLYELQERLMTAQQRHSLELMTYGMGDQAAAELRERVALQEQQQAELRQMQHQHGQELRAAETEEQKAHLQTMFEERFRLTQDALAEELRLYDEATKQKQAKEKDWLAGAKAGMETYVRDASNGYEATKQLAQNTFKGMEDSLVSVAKTGKANAADLFGSILEGLVRIQIQEGMTKMFGGANGGVLGSMIQTGLSWLTGGASGASAASGGNAAGGMRLPGRATGGPVVAGGMYEVNELGMPELLNVGGKQVLMMAGQSGYVTPLAAAAWSGGGAAGQAAANVASTPLMPEVHVHNYAGAKVEQRQRSGPDGKALLDLFINAAADQLADGYGALDQAMTQRERLRG